MKNGFLRAAAVTPAIKTADCAHNAQAVLSLINERPQDTSLMVFPELCLTGYTCGDLFLQQTLLQAAEAALQTILQQTADVPCVLVLGLPVAVGAAVYNCAAVCCRGLLLGLVPKRHLPTYSEFYESRHFTAPADGLRLPVRLAGQDTLLCASQLFCCRELPQFVLGVEICEDLWVADPPSGTLARQGATVLANLSASDEAIGKDAYRRSLVSMQSARLCAGYVYADAGEGESTTDLVFSGQNLIAENGVLLAESRRYTTGILSTELDLDRLLAERRRLTTFTPLPACHTVFFSLPIKELTLTRRIPAYPFVPEDNREKDARCEDILSIQAEGLASRLRHTHACAVLGLSGGLDSSLALLVTVRAFDRIGRSRKEIHAVTMPCFGTTSRTRNNARVLAQACGVTLHEIAIGESVTQHLSDIGHEGAHDITYENAQARERTQVLMDLANRFGGLVIGTGDLSELALGWATYNGDHMSMYGVNASVPKTLVRSLTSYEARRLGGAIETALLDVLDTPVSPELLPPENGEIAQKTEQLVGPYALHDFFLYYLLRFGFPPEKIFRLAVIAFQGVYEPTVIKQWLCVFLRRFFAQQFKRSCLPDGPRVGSVALSPRGDWRMPSDASAQEWLVRAESIEVGR